MEDPKPAEEPSSLSLRGQASRGRHENSAELRLQERVVAGSQGTKPGKV